MRTEELIITWSIISSILIALFWTISYHFYGYVPLITNVKIFEGSAFSWTYNLPFSISHWWDIFIGPIFTSAIVFFLTKTGKKKIYFLYFSLTICLTTIFGLGIGAGIIFGIFIGKKMYYSGRTAHEAENVITTNILSNGLALSIFLWGVCTLITAGFFGMNFSLGALFSFNLTYSLIVLINKMNIARRALMA